MGGELPFRNRRELLFYYYSSMLSAVLIALVLMLLCWPRASAAAPGVSPSSSGLDSGAGWSSSPVPSSVSSSDVSGAYIDSLASAPGTVPLSAEKPASYFRDAVFVGDAFTEGLLLYNTVEGLGEDNLAASTNLNPARLSEAGLTTDADGQACTLAERVISLHPKKLYFLLGSNGVAWLDPQGMAAFLQEIDKALPDCNIYVQSIFPFTASLCQSNTSYDNADVRAYNELLYQMAVDNGWHFVHTYAALAGEDGALPESLSGDGVHIGPDGYQRWIAYLQSHTAEKQAQTQIVFSESSATEPSE